MSRYFSTGAFLTGDLQKIVAVGLEQGINIELGSALPYSPGLLDPVKRAKGRVRFLVHNYFPPPEESFVLNLASTDAMIHFQSMEVCRRAIDLCSELGAPFYSVHAGFAFHIAPEELGNPSAQARVRPEQRIPRKQAYERFVFSVKELAAYASHRKIGFAVENNVLTAENVTHKGSNPLLLADIEEISRFFGDIDDSPIGLLLDTGHAKVSALTRGVRPEKYLEVLWPHIRALHLSDNDGTKDSHQAFNRYAWFAPFLKEMATYPCVIEVSRLTTEKMLDQLHTLEEMLV